MSTQKTPFPDLPAIGIEFPRSPVAAAAFAYTKEHTSEATYNHCVRSAYWALILAKKLPGYANPPSPLNLETVVLANVLHDMGWATTKALRSKDKRFEVDGANLALAFLRRYAEEGGEGGQSWKNDAHRARLVWDAIALHTTGSIAVHHPAPEVALAHLGVMADFQGPLFPPGGGAVIAEAEYREVVRHFPLAGFGREGVKEIMCGLCREKPETTYDNFVSAFGLAFGVDGKGGGREEFAAAMKRGEPLWKILEGLGYLEELLGKEA
ncbi:hypothetical protein F5Y05DRAFT_178848 [Hypoxylon sp. FL0543]|nr:hypothetical protein F5Y05DRAFT_178848 [Hypoxylon sp. FL0543]